MFFEDFYFTENLHRFSQEAGSERDANGQSLH